MADVESSIVQTALDRGYSVDEIADKIAQDNGTDPATIRERGYGSAEILSKFGYKVPKPGIIDRAVGALKSINRSQDALPEGAGFADANNAEPPEPTAEDRKLGMYEDRAQGASKVKTALDNAASILKLPITVPLGMINEFARTSAELAKATGAYEQAAKSEGLKTNTSLTGPYAEVMGVPTGVDEVGHSLGMALGMMAESMATPSATLATAGRTLRGVAQTLGDTFGPAFRAAIIPGLTSASEVMHSVYEKTGDKVQAFNAGLTSMAGTTAMFSAPVALQGSKGANILSGMALQPGMSEASKVISNTGLPDDLKQPVSLVDAYTDPKTLATGAVFGGVLGRARDARQPSRTALGYDVPDLGTIVPKEGTVNPIPKSTSAVEQLKTSVAPDPDILSAPSATDAVAKFTDSVRGPDMGQTGRDIAVEAKAAAPIPVEVPKGVVRDLDAQVNMVSEAHNADSLKFLNARNGTDFADLGEAAAAGHDVKPFNILRATEADVSGSVPVGQRTVARLVAKAFGKSLTYIKDANGNEIADGVYGGSLKGGDENRIFVDIKAQYGAVRIVGHEIGHALENQMPGAYKALHDALSGDIDSSSQADRYLRRYSADYATLGGQLEKGQITQDAYDSAIAGIKGKLWDTDSNFHREVISDLIGDHLTDVTFWLDMATKLGKGKGSDLLNVALKIANKAVDAVGNKFLAGAKDSKVIISSRDAILDAMAKYKAMVDNGTVSSAEKPGEVKPPVQEKTTFTKSEQTPKAEQPVLKPATSEAETRTPFAKKDATPDDFEPKKVKDLLKRDNWAILTAEKSSLTPEENAARMDELRTELKKRGLDFEDVKGQYYGGKENSVIVRSIPEKTAAELGKKYDQDSVLTRKGFLFQDGTVSPAKGVDEYDTEPADNFTRVTRTGALFRVDIPDYDHRVPLAGYEPMHGVQAAHFSTEPRTSLSGAYYGRGAKGAEAERLKNAPPEIRNRTHYYASTGEGVKPEEGVGTQAHINELNNLYDADRNALKLPFGKDPNGAEMAVVKAGYDGYVTRGFNGQAAVVRFGADPIATEHVGGVKEVDARLEHLAPAEKTAESATREALLSEKRLPAGELKGSEWQEVLPKLAPELAKKVDLTALDADKSYYRDQLPLKASEAQMAKKDFKEVDTESPEFKKWFGDSKVVDRGGKPLTVYHGTGADFREFDATKTFDGGLYFTDNRGHAAEFGEIKGGDMQNILPTYLSLKNPLTIDAEGVPFDESMQKRLESEIHRGKQTGQFDGIVVKNLDALGYGNVSDMYVAFSPTQIKSAISNTGDFSSKNPDIRFSKKDREHEFEMSPRQPTGGKAKDSSLGDPILQIGFDTIKRDPKKLAHMAELIRSYPNYREAKSADTPEKIIERFMAQGKDNLLWLYDQVPEAIRERAKLWYDGGHTMTKNIAEEYGYTHPQTAGVFAVLSPKKSWFENISLGERVIHLWNHRANLPAWSDEMSSIASRIYTDPKFKSNLDAIKGKRLSELDDVIQQAMWVRAFDEAHNDRSYQVTSPEGNSLGTQRNFSGVEAVAAWSNLDNIAKALLILQDGSYSSIDANLGNAHKVRSFYNNLLIPNSANGHVTADTHSVAAINLRPLALVDREPSHNFNLYFKGDAAAGVNANEGFKGTYGINADIYRQAAAERGILPREMQSITWEAVRGLFERENKKFMDFDHLWEDFKKGKVSLENTRSRILEAAGGIRAPSWHEPGARVDGEGQSAPNEAGVADAQLPGGRTESTTRRTAGTDTADSEVTPFAKKDREWYYSALSKAIEQFPAKVRTGTEMSMWLTANSAKLGVKKEEIEWSGVNDWLKLRGKEKVSPAEVQEFLDGNGVQVRDVVLGGKNRGKGGIVVAESDERGGWDVFDDSGLLKNFKTEDLAQAWVNKKFGEEPQTKFASYQLPGGTNYRELLITLPERKAEPTPSEERRRELEGKNNRGQANKAEFAELLQLRNTTPRTDERVNFTSSHFDQKNILAHIRMNDRTDATGRKVLFLEELQSDWGQKGKKEGFKIEESAAERMRHEKAQQAADTLLAGRSMAALTHDEQVEWNRLQGEASPQVTPRTGVPAAPFVTDTKAWTGLALKRAIAYAAEHGYDAIAWTNGEQQAARYDLSKQVKSIDYTRDTAGEYTLHIKLVGDGGYETLRGLNESKLEDTIGKDATRKILANEGRGVGAPEGSGNLSGLDLKVGGEGMKGYYDQIVPQVANDVLRKIGGGRVGDVALQQSERFTVDQVSGDWRVIENGGFYGPVHPNEEAAQAVADRMNSKLESSGLTQPGFDITDAMRKQATENGLPLFAKKSTNPDLPPEETRLQGVQRKLQDNFNRFKVVQDWAAEHGIQINDTNDTYNAEIRMHGRFANKAEDFRKLTLEPLVTQVQKDGFTMKQVSEFLLNQHAEEANKVNKTINPTRDSAYGITTPEARAYLAKADPKLAALANQFQAITEDTKKLRLAAGLLTPEEVAPWDAAYQHYVPVKGGDKETQQGAGKGLSVSKNDKRRLGHGLRDEYVAENIARAHETALLQIEHNEVGKHLLAFAVDLNNPDVISIDAPEKRQVLQPGKTTYTVQDKNGNVVSAYDTNADALRFITDSGKTNYLTVVPSKGDPSVQYAARPQLADNEALVYIAGRRVRMQINDPMLAQEYKKLGTERLTGIFEVGRAVNAWLSKSYTGYNPEFLLRNIRRDFASGSINIAADYGAETAALAAKEYPSSFMEMLRFSMSGTRTPMVDLYREHGGNVGAAYLSDIERIGADIQKNFDHATGVLGVAKEGRYGAASRVAFEKGIGSLAGWIEHLNAAGENAMRLAVFKALIDSGKSPEQAAVAAKGMTLNFNKKGEIGPQLSAMYLFYNPSVQDAARLMKSLLTADHKSQAWALTGTLAAIALATAVSQYGDDKDGEFRRIPPNVRNKSIVIRTGKDTYLTWDVPYGYGWFFALGNAAYEMSLGEDPKKISLHVAAGFLDNFSPVGNPVDATGEINRHELAPFEPFRDWLRFGANRTSFGNPIMPDKDSDQKKPDHLRMWRGTQGSSYDKMTQWLNDQTGGTKTRAGAIDVSPETIKWGVGVIGGGTARFLSDTLNLTTLGARAITEPAETRPGLKPDIREIPIVRGVAQEASISWYRSQFYDLAKDATEALDAFKLAKKEGDVKAIKEMSNNDIAMVSLAKAVTSYQKAIKAQRDREVAVQLDQVHSEGWKRMQLKEIEVGEQRLYQSFFGQYQTIKESARARPAR